MHCQGSDNLQFAVKVQAICCPGDSVTTYEKT